ncbi:hypothetical protein SUGI_0578310 [Cryptomeria japonica]|nr:hypothetical protein SUGI_0578310 [Cryptomeria japonica]
MFSVLMARGSTLGKTKEQELEEALTQKRELLLKRQSFSDGIAVQKQRETDLVELQRFIDGLVDEIETREARRERRIQELAAEAEERQASQIRTESRTTTQNYVPDRRKWRHARMHQLERVLTEAKMELTWLQAEEKEDQISIAQEQESVLEEFSQRLYQGEFQEESSSRSTQKVLHQSFSLSRKGVRFGQTIDLDSGMTEEEEAIFEQIQNKISDQKFKDFLNRDSSDDEEQYDRRSKSSFMASTICPTIEMALFPARELGTKPTSSTKCMSVPIPNSYQKQQKKDRMSWIGKKMEKAESEIQQIQQEFSQEVMSKVLSHLKRDLWCSLPLKKDESGHYPAIAQARRNLNRLLRKDPPAWTSAHNDDIQRIKDTCSTLAPLHLPGKGEKIVETDASEHCWGAVLKEKDSSGTEVPVRYASGTFQGAEQRYHSTHKEILAVVKAFEQFELFIHDQPFLVRSDLNNLQSFLNATTKKKVARNRLLRWVEYLTQFDYRTEHLKGTKNIFADFLSREFNGTEEEN